MKRLTTIACLLLCLLGYAQAKERVIDRPPFIAWSSTSIEVDKVVLSDTATILHIKASYRPKYWIKIATGSFLKASNGKNYPLRQGIGITPDKEFWMPESGEAEFQLVFPPLPNGVTSVDFSEGDFEGAYQVYGIQLMSNALPKLILPKEAIIHQQDHTASLPQPIMAAGTATIKGQILDYCPEMFKEISLELSEPIKGFEDGTPIKINADGSFSLATPVMETTPANFTLFGKRIKFFLVPGQTTGVIINTRELCRQQSKLHRADKPYGEAVYFSGALAGFAQELNQDAFRKIAERGHSSLKEVENMDVNAYKLHTMSKYAERQNVINQSSLSKAAKQLLNIENDMNAAQNLCMVANMLTQAKVEKKEITTQEARSAYYDKLSKELPADYYDPMKSLGSINTPSALMSENYMYSIYLLTQIVDKLPQIWNTNKGTFFDIVSASVIYQTIKDFAPLTEERRADLALLPPAYKAGIEAENVKLLAKLEANKKKTGFTVNEAGEVSNEDLFPSIIAKFRGKVLLVDFWATWCGPCRMANKAMIPMKKELENKEIVYIYIAGENSPLKTWENMIPDIHGEHFRVTEAQWVYLREAFDVKGVPTYILVDREGNIVYKATGFSGTDTMKGKLLEALDKK